MAKPTRRPRSVAEVALVAPSPADTDVGFRTIADFELPDPVESQWVDLGGEG